MAHLTENERLVLRVIQRHQQRHDGAAPTYGAIAHAMGWRSPAYAGAIVRRLVARGVLSRGVLRIAGGPEDRALVAELRALAGVLQTSGAVGRALLRAADRIAVLTADCSAAKV
ncbi:MAG: hypothetical protein JSR82_24405 [Verrucomicrobia bacterium]|nr:hypothetical protein [Verrucomicrobiota bacterium]